MQYSMHVLTANMVMILLNGQKTISYREQEEGRPLEGKIPASIMEVELDAIVVIQLVPLS